MNTSMITKYAPVYIGVHYDKRGWARKPENDKPSIGRIILRPEGYVPDPVRRGTKERFTV